MNAIKYALGEGGAWHLIDPPIPMTLEMLHSYWIQRNSTKADYLLHDPGGHEVGNHIVWEANGPRTLILCGDDLPICAHSILFDTGEIWDSYFKNMRPKRAQNFLWSKDSAKT